MGLSMRQCLVFTALVLLVPAVVSEAWVAWSTLLSLVLLWLMLDCLFFNDAHYDYDPDYKNWARRQDAKT